MDALLSRLEIELKSRGFSAKTIKSYMFHTSCFLNKVGTQAPDENVKRYFAELSDKMEPRTINQRISAVKFFYRNVLGKDMLLNYMKKPNRIPEILTKDEMRKMIASILNMKHRLLVEIIYGCGLRVSEAANLKKCDLRFEEGVLFVR